MREVKMKNSNLFSKTTFSICYLIVTAMIFLISGCMTTKAHVQRSNLTFGMIKKKLVKGETNQAEILSLFGAPNIMTKNRSGEEVWTYDKIAVSTSEAGGALGVGAGGIPGGTLIGGGAGVSGRQSSTGSRSMTLVITFGEKDIVKDYAVMAQEF